jgi:hypothetical protein
MKMTRGNKRWSGGVWLGGVALLTAVRCGSGASADMAAAPGQERAGESTDVAEDPSRELQESDIYKRVGDRLFILNRFRGLMVANATNLDAPVLEGRMPLPAEPREMWLNNDTAIIITAQEDAYSGWGWWGDSTNVDVDTWASYKGSALVLANVSNPQHPQLSSILKLGGDCFDGRLRGSMLYVACSAASWADDGGASSHIFSVDVSNPQQPIIVGSAGFDRGGADQHLMVGDNMMYLASTNAGSTSILMVDISAADGTITRRGTVTVPLAVPDRFAMDAYNGALRVASGSAGNADVHLTTFDISNPDAPVQLAQYTLMINESLKSARFDANRGYLVTFRNVDPLYVFDLTNPAQPRILGELKMPGWLDFMVPMGDRLICMGHDDITQTQAGTLGLVRMTRRTLAVSLIDVGSSGPRVLSRVPLDGSWGTIPAERDDYNKLFRVFPNEGLVMFPYRTFSSYGYARQAGMLLIDWANDALTLKADLNNIGLVERGILWDASTLVTLSVQVMQVFDIADRANPRARGAVELARQVSAFAKVGDNHLVELTGDIGVGSATLNARALGGVDPDAAPLSSVTLDSPAGFIQSNGNLVYVVGVHHAAMATGYDDAEDGNREPEVPTTVTVVDYADPAHPVVRSSLSLPEEVTFWNQGIYGYATDVVVQPSAGVLVLQKPPYYGGYGCSDSSKPARLFVLDLRNPDAPTLAKTLDGPRWGAQMEGGGGRVFVVDYQAVSVLDVRDPSNVKMGKEVKAENVLATNAATGDVLRMQYGYSSSGFRTTQQEQALLLDRLGDDGLRAVSRLPTDKYFYGGRLVNGWYWGSDYQSTGLVKVDGDTLGWVDVAGADLALNGSGRLVAATGDTVFVETGNAIQVLRSSGGTMGQRMTIKVAGRADSAMLQGDVVYVAAGYHGLVRVPLAQ